MFGELSVSSYTKLFDKSTRLSVLFLVSMETSPDKEQEERKLAEVLTVIDKEIMACGFGSKDLAEFKEIATKDYNARNATVSMFSANKRKAQRLADIRRNPYFGRID